MKALSVRQPWADLILSGDKKIEIRSWSTNHRGPLIICASAYKCRLDDGEILPHGVMICVVDLVEVRPLNFLDLPAAMINGYNFDVTGQKAWVLEKPREVVMAPVKGRLHLFDIDDALIKFL